ncbi:glycosyltransferase family 10 [Hymenobacter saemangeumensis]|uniref:Glycosyltransferase family 10 n=1 Tax=Hymenobacter saemangeumensis TaxID=1084522 RepID=A0ABP8IT30_9BACT
MIKATLYVREHPCLSNDAIFSGAPMEGMKSDAFMVIELRRLLAEHGIALATQEVHPPSESAIVISHDHSLPFQAMRRAPGQKWYLLLYETATYHPHNYQPENQQVFDRIFTYNETVVDNRRFFLYRYAIDFESYPPFQRVTEAEFNRRKLCTLVAAAFGISPAQPGSGSLLHERYQALKWFSDNHPEELDFFSRGIDEKELQSLRGAGLLRRVLPAAFFTWLGHRRRRVFDRVFRGSIPPDDKISRLRDYRFAIAYENTGNVPGYLSEKLFDCLAAGVIPIYLGDPTVTKTIPADCFIDRRLFPSYEALYAYLKQMDYAEYARRIASIEAYLAGPGPAQLSSRSNAQAIAKVLLQDLEPSG